LHPDLQTDSAAAAATIKAASDGPIAVHGRGTDRRRVLSYSPESLDKDFAAARKPAGSLTASSVKVGLTKVNGAWLIYAFDPV
jgi:Mce-associated membrane protein